MSYFFLLTAWTISKVGCPPGRSTFSKQVLSGLGLFLRLLLLPGLGPGLPLALLDLLLFGLGFGLFLLDLLDSFLLLLGLILFGLSSHLHMNSPDDQGLLFGLLALPGFGFGLILLLFGFGLSISFPISPVIDAKNSDTQLPLTEPDSELEHSPSSLPFLSQR